jgi:hypothetical protein
MFQVGRWSRIVALCVFVGALPSLAAAQDAGSSSLRLPTMAAGAAAAADWGTTYYALKHFRLREVNPLLSPMQDAPGRMISVGAAMDVGLVSIWNLTLGRDHERLAAAGLWAMTAFRAYLAVHNLRNTKKAARRVPLVPTPLVRPATLDAAMTCEAPASGPACVAVVRTAQ